MYRQRPSEIYHLDDELTAWCFDRAVAMFGSAVDEEVEDATHDAKNRTDSMRKAQTVLSRWLGTAQKFRDPSGNAGTVSL